MSDNFELVAVDANKQNTLRSRIDETKKMLLSRLNPELRQARVGNAEAVRWVVGIIGRMAAVKVGLAIDELINY